MKLWDAAFGTLASVALMAGGASGCAAPMDTPSGSVLGTADAQLVADDEESNNTDQDLESGIDEPLGGGTPAEPSAPAAGATDADLLAHVKANAGRFFQPAGCLTSTIAGNVLTHVFNDCAGPYGLKTFSGTVVATWVRGASSVTVTYEATNFQISGATISGSRVVVTTKSGSLVTKTRTGDWGGTTAKGKPVTHTANFVTTYDLAAMCMTRDGHATTSVGKRAFERTIAGYKRCGVGRLGCPQSGEVVLSRTQGSATTTLTIDFLGGTADRVTLPNGKTVSRTLTCDPSAG